VFVINEKGTKMIAQSVGDALRAYLAGIETLSRYIGLKHFTPIAHDSKIPNFADAVEYSESGGAMLRTFPGTEFWNKDGVYVAQVERGQLTMLRIRRQ